jgi:hypothetical protein
LATTRLAAPIQGQSAQFIDGVANNILNGNIVALVPTQDAIQEFSVASSNATADFGRFAGGVVNMATKSGSNAFHGSAWEYVRNRDFNANDYFSNMNALLNPRVKYNQNQFGAAISGPIMKDKAFFMFTWEGYKLNAANVTPTNVPTAAMQSGIIPEHYSANLVSTTNPTGLVTVADPSGACPITHQAGTAASPGTWTMPQSCWDPMNAVLKNIFPNPNANVSGSNWFKATPIGNNQNQYNGRVDYALSPSDRLFARYTYWTLLDVPHTEFNDQGNPAPAHGRPPMARPASTRTRLWWERLIPSAPAP